MKGEDGLDKSRLGMSAILPNPDNDDGRNIKRKIHIIHKLVIDISELSKKNSAESDNKKIPGPA